VQFLGFNQLKGSCANLPTHWAGGVRARNLTAHFALQNTKPRRRGEHRGNALARRLGGALRHQRKNLLIFQK
jgi:hypothetical protein